MTARSVALILAISLVFAGCAPVSQPPVADPPLAAGFSRIYFYRTTFSIGSESGLFGNVARPSLSLDGKTVAETPAGSVIFCDVLPGRHEVAVRANQRYTLDLAAKPDRTHYVKLDWGMGGLTGQGHVTEVAASVGSQDIEGRPRLAATCPQAGG
ncbi:MAG: DUF2846 domain-containing protein [Ferrovibrio sp.]|uniref:DUF2846 domain-containing protein n=1 Tax=Ferrovibrio sp. TaxID=1917215 RepID=UPI00391DF6A3